MRTFTGRFRSQSGLTLAELLIALAISSTVVLFTLSLTTDALLQSKRSDYSSELSYDFDLFTDYFSREIPNAGGQDIPAKAAYFTENDCVARDSFPDCNHSDRITLATSNQPATCSIVSYNASAKTATLLSVAGICCLTGNSLANRQVLFSNGTSFAQHWVQSSNEATCEINFVDGPMSPNDHFDATFIWNGALVLPVDIVTFYVDPTTDFFYKKTYDGTTALSGTASLVADRVVDFQVALGFDFKPNDGVLLDNADNQDEWLNNSPGESMSDTNFSAATVDTLKMVELSWILGSPSATSKPATATILDGPARTRNAWLFRTGAVKLAIKSTYLFQ